MCICISPADKMALTRNDIKSPSAHLYVVTIAFDHHSTSYPTFFYVADSGISDEGSLKTGNFANKGNWNPVKCVVVANAVRQPPLAGTVMWRSLARSPTLSF